MVLGISIPRRRCRIIFAAWRQISKPLQCAIRQPRTDHAQQHAAEHYRHLDQVQGKVTKGKRKDQGGMTGRMDWERYMRQGIIKVISMHNRMMHMIRLQQTGHLILRKPHIL